MFWLGLGIGAVLGIVAGIIIGVIGLWKIASYGDDSDDRGN